jgi:serine/threonine-protein kinase
VGTRICPRCHALQPRHQPPPSQRHPRDLRHGRVTYEHKLGEGATAVVWKGSYFRFTGSGYEPPVPVAIKEIRAGLQVDTARALLRNEAVALGALSALAARGAEATVNVVQLVDAVDSAPEAGGPALVFELIPGETLEARLRRQVWAASRAGRRPGEPPGMPYGAAWTFFAQLTAALAAVHASGQVHADVKPANAILRPDGVLKLTDFGLARPVGARVGADEAGAGTSAYMSPEQALGHPLGPTSDLYSAATVLFEMLAGRTPFDLQGRNELAVRMDQIHREPPRLSSFVPAAPPQLDQLLHAALAKSPTQRFQSAVDMRAAFAPLFRDA